MIRTLPHLLFHQGLRNPTTTAQLSKDEKGVFQPVSYKELSDQMMNFGAGLISIGTEKGEHVGHLSDNRQEWQVISLGIQAIGCSDIPRGTDVTVKEMAYILSFTKCRTVSVENPYVLGKLCECLNEIPTLENIILVDDQNQALDKYDLGNIKLYRYYNILREGKKWREEHPNKMDTMILDGKITDTATIIFTSGTTGVPKGVELTHENFICQLQPLAERLDFHRADRCMCILPIWHVYERLFEYYIMYFAGTLCYSKPVVSILLQDFQKVRPQLMPCVPRVWEGLYQAISKKLKKQSKFSWIAFKIVSKAAGDSLNMKDIIKGTKKSFKKRTILKVIFSKLLIIPYGILFPLRRLGEKLYFKNLREIVGGQFRCGISGGGGLPPKLDRFFNSIGVNLLEAYGLTETAPLVAIRDRNRPVMGTIGKNLRHCEVKIVKEDGTIAKPGEKGILHIRGTNVMNGYYLQPELTAKVKDSEGWFNSGDIALSTYNGELMIRGRQKDTIVLKSGENVEPFPIEAKLSESPYIQQAVVVGQDENSLGALVIPAVEAIKQAASNDAKAGKIADNTSKLLASDFAKELIMREMERLICAKNGFKNFERVNQFVFLEKFENPSEELSAKGEIIRYKINSNYKHLINAMFLKETKKRQRLSEIIQNLLD